MSKPYASGEEPRVGDEVHLGRGEGTKAKVIKGLIFTILLIEEVGVVPDFQFTLTKNQHTLEV